MRMMRRRRVAMGRRRKHRRPGRPRMRRRRRGGAPALVRRAAAAPMGLLDRAKAFLKKHQLVSRGLKGFSSLVSGHEKLGSLSVPASALGELAAAHGYGRRRRRVHHRKRRVGRPRKRRGGHMFAGMGRKRRVGRPRKRRIMHRRRRGGNLSQILASTSKWSDMKHQAMLPDQSIFQRLIGAAKNLKPISRLARYLGHPNIANVASRVGLGRRRRRVIHRRRRRVMHRRRRGGNAFMGYGRRRRMGGSAFTDFFTKTIPGAARKVGSFISEKVRKPSTWLGAAGLLPTPLAPILKGASFVSGLAGHGRRRRHRRHHMMRRGRGASMASLTAPLALL